MTQYVLGSVLALIIVAMVLQVAAVVVSIVLPGHKLLNLVFPVVSALTAAALVVGFNPEVEGMAYVITGLENYSLIAQFVNSVIIGGIVVLANIVTGFMSLEKNV